MSLEHIIPVVMRYIKGEPYDKADMLSFFSDDIKTKDSERNNILLEFEKITDVECEKDPTIDAEIKKIEEYSIDEYILIDSLEHSLKVDIDL